MVYRGVKMDSDEEVFVAMWLQELQEAGLISRWKKVDSTIELTQGLKLYYKKITQLKTKLKVEDKYKTLLNDSEYTPDFKIEFTEKGLEKLVCVLDVFEATPEWKNRNAIFFTSNNHVLVEVKPSFDQNNMERLFKNNQKFIWDKHKIFVNLVEPIALFEKTFIPLAAAPYFKYKVVTKKLIAKGKKKGDWKFDFVPKTLNEFIYV